MSDKDRKKKDGEDTNKKNQRMHEAVAERHKNDAGPGVQHDEEDVRKFKSGSENDRTTHNQQGSTS